MKKYANFLKIIKMNLKHKYILISSIIALIISSVINSILPIIIMKIIDNISNKATEILPAILLFIIISIFQILLQLASNYGFSLLGKKVIKELKIKIITHLYGLDGNYISNLNVGEHLSILEQDTNSIEYVATKTIFSIISDIISCIITLFALMSIQLDLSLYILVIEGIIILVQINLNKYMVRLRKLYRNLSGAVTDIEQETLSKIMDIIQMNGKDFLFEKYLNKLNSFMTTYLKIDLLNNVKIAILGILKLMSIVFIFSYGAYKVSLDLLTIGGVVAIISYSEKVFAPILRILNSNLQIQQSIIAIDKIFSFLEIEPKITSGQYKADICGEIALTEAAFKYNSKSKKIIYNNINFKKNSINVIMGNSGAGKTSITKLLYRFWDVNEGCIEIDDKNIKNYDINCLRCNLAIVPQNMLIINDTILNNITLDCNVEMSYIYEVCSAVKIHEFIMELPEKYETIIGSDGISLSGGQIQRILIARALIRDAKILIMDEPTSALDENLEQEVWRNIVPLLKKRTTIIITHKKGILKCADNVFNIDSVST